MYIAYLTPDYTNELEYDAPSNHEESKLIDVKYNKMKAIIAHPDTVFYSPIEFAEAFNDELISDLGYIAFVDNLKNKAIIY